MAPYVGGQIIAHLIEKVAYAIGPGLIQYYTSGNGFRHTAAPSILVGLISDRLVQIVNPFGPGSVRSSVKINIRYSAYQIASMLAPLVMHKFSWCY